MDIHHTAAEQVDDLVNKGIVNRLLQRFRIVVGDTVALFTAGSIQIGLRYSLSGLCLRHPVQSGGFGIGIGFFFTRLRHGNRLCTRRLGSRRHNGHVCFNNRSRRRSNRICL